MINCIIQIPLLQTDKFVVSSIFSINPVSNSSSKVSGDQRKVTTPYVSILATNPLGAKVVVQYIWQKYLTGFEALTFPLCQLHVPQSK